MENLSIKLRQKTGPRKRREEGAVVFSKAEQNGLPDTGPGCRDLKEGRAQTASLRGRVLRAEDMQKGAFSVQFRGLQGGQRGCRGRGGDRLGAANGTGTAQRRGNFSVTSCKLLQLLL